MSAVVVLISWLSRLDDTDLDDTDLDERGPRLPAILLDGLLARRVRSGDLLPQRS